MSTTRSLPQIIFNHLPGSLIYDDKQGCLGRIIKVTGPPDASIELNRLTDRIRFEIDRWCESENDESGTTNPEVGYLQPNDIEVVRPEYVEWELFPYYFRCKRNTQCGIWQWKRDLFANEGQCHQCQGALEQTPFVWIHHCGYIQPLAPGTKAHCPTHAEKYLHLFDTGTFVTSSWRCRKCGHQANIGFMHCPQCKSTKPRPQPMRWNDPGVFSSVTFQMINLSEEDRQRLITSNNKYTILSAVLSANLEPGKCTINNLADESGEICPQCNATPPATAKFCPECGYSLPTSDTYDAVDEYTQYDEIFDDLVTYALLWDLAGTSSLRTVEEWDAVSRFGVADITHMERFPISLVGLGYRRQKSKRPATLCLFEPESRSKSVRVFTNSMELEACAIRLDSGVVLQWLEANGLLDSGTTEMATKNTFDELYLLVANSPPIQQAVLGLLHSISHSYIIGLSWCSGMDLVSFSEELLPGVLTAVIHAGDTSLGGLSSVFKQVPWQPLELVSEDLVACQLDPACSEDDGGSCVACLQLPRGCTLWNSSLSRAYLFGGQTKDGFYITRGFWQR